MTATITAPGTDARIDRIHPLRVERVVELGEPDDRHAVVLHLEARHLLPTLVRALSGHAADMLTIRTRRPGDAEWHAAVERVANDTAVRDACTVTLGPDQAEATYLDLFAAAEAPAECDGCGHYVDLASGPECSACYAVHHQLDGRCGA